MIKGGLCAYKGKRVLLLQGPLGPFFARLAQDLRAVGAHVSKINFNGGDQLFYPVGAVAFRGDLAAWPDFFITQLQAQSIEVVLLFGDCRPLHRLAHQIALARGVQVGVFEEGYVRPNFITLERNGVNGYSQLSRDPQRVMQNAEAAPPEVEIGKVYFYAACWAMLYYAASALARPWFRHYQHHRSLSIFEGLYWIRAWWRKAYFKWAERGQLAQLVGQHSKRYFLVPLQVHNDMQVQVHSPFAGLGEFLDVVVASFASHAPSDTLLVIKHHPLDRGYADYRKCIEARARAAGIGHRVQYIHDQHLPTLLAHARGLVVINSTVGLSALWHGIPVKVCGRAVYEMAGLTYQGELAHFWQAAQQQHVDAALFARFRTALIRQTQINGNFYKRLSGAASKTGLRW